MATKRELVNCITKLQLMVEEMRLDVEQGSADVNELALLNELISELSEKLEFIKEDIITLSKYL